MNFFLFLKVFFGRLTWRMMRIQRTSIVIHHNFQPLPSLCVYLQTGEYATDEEEEMSPVFPNSIEVFDLAENQEMLSPVELDPEKLAHKFKEVYLTLKQPNCNPFVCCLYVCVCVLLLYSLHVYLSLAPDQTCSNPGGDPAAEEEGEAT